MNERPNVQILYSLTVTNPEQRATMIEPQPKWHELLYAALIDLAWTCVLPAALFALAWLLLMRR